MKIFGMISTPALLSAFVLMAAPVLADALDRPVSSGGRGEAASTATESAPRSEAGAPFVGLQTITAADIEATGARVVRGEAARPDAPSALVERLMEEAGPESIINWDSRMRMYTNRYPNRAIVYIQLNGRHHCTGFMISANTVATAGHCVHEGRGGTWYDRRQFQVFPGRDGASSPYGSCGVTRLHSVTGWTRNSNANNDYGAMRLNCTIGNTVGWFGLYSRSGNRAFNNEPAIISGYPGDGAQQQWLSADRVRQSLARRVCYRADTIGGHSGSPVWSDRDAALATSGAWAYAIHAYGVWGSVCGGNMNYGPRLVPAVVNNFVNWINQS